MSSTFLRVSAVLVVTWATCWGLHWTSDLPEGAAKYVCQGDSLVLPWNYTTSPGDDVLSIQWFSRGASQQLIAIFSRGNFAPMASFANRARYLSGAGLSLSKVTTGDTGNYSVEVSGHDASGSFFVYHRTVIVHITENKLSTTANELHTMLEPKAIYSNTTGQWSLVVSCGHFIFPGDPPFDIEWLTPSSVVPLQSSTGYKDGYFQLHVTSGGDYTCRIPQQAAADLCLHNVTRQATVHVDKMEARMTLMEARQQQIEEDNEQLKQKEANLTDYILRLEARLDQKDANLSQSLLSLASKVSRQIAFTTYLSHTYISSGRFIFDHIVNNYGNGYNSSSGYFITPVDGLYFFVLTYSPASNDYYPDIEIRVEGSVVCSTASQTVGKEGSCGAAVHLTAGQLVYAWSSYRLTTLYMSFSGFLITSD